MTLVGTAAADRTFLAHLDPWAERGLRVGSLRGRERLSAPYRYDVRALTPEFLGPERIPPVGTPMTLALFTEEGNLQAPRYVHGVLTRAQHHGTDHDREGSWLGLRLEPRLALLKYHRTRRVFQDRTVAQIADMLLASHHAPWRWAGELPTQRLAHVVQYDETDFAFLQRLFARHGVLYFFEHAARVSGADAHETLVLCDDARHYAQLTPLEGTQPRTLHHAHGDARGRAEESLLSLEPVTRVRPTGVRLRDTDVRTPNQRPEQARSAESEPVLGREALRVDDFEHRSGNDEVRFRAVEARVALEQARADSTEVLGSTDCAALTAGMRFAAGDHPLDALNARWVVTEITHEARVPTLLPDTGTNAATGAVGYVNRFRAAPSDRTVRPARPARVMRQVCETAVVVGPANEEVFTDALGRIKVQFPWDHEGGYDERSSCWIRVAQTIAGNGWGSQWLPRVGMEILVTYVGGDTDHPLVTACLYNGDAATPFALPASRTRSGLRTRSSPGGAGSNELSFEDAAGHEQVLVRAHRNLEVAVGHDAIGTIARNESRSVGNQQTTEVSGRQSVSVGQDRTINVGGSQQHHVEKAHESTVGGISRTDVGADWEVSARSQVGLFSGEDFVIGAGQNLECTIAGDHLVTVEGGSSALRVRGQYSATVGHEATLQSDVRLVLRCGDSSIEIGPDEIVLTAKQVRLSCDKVLEVETASSSLTINDNINATSAKISLLAEGSELALGTEAHLKGERVKLARGAGGSTSATRDTENEAPKEHQLQFSVHVGNSLPHDSEAKLSILDDRSALVADLYPSQGTYRDGLLSFTLNPALYPTAVQVRWTMGNTSRVLAGPVSLQRLCEQLSDESFDRTHGQALKQPVVFHKRDE